MSSPVSSTSVPVVPVDMSRPQLSRSMSSMPMPRTMSSVAPYPLSGNVYTALVPPAFIAEEYALAKKDARIAELECELAKRDAKIADLEAVALAREECREPISLEGAWNQLFSVYQEMDDKWTKARADYGDDRSAIDASGILDTPEWARFNFEEEYDCISKVYDRIPVVYRGF
jgi:uncharacterized coiled-coil protein SlyX